MMAILRKNISMVFLGRLQKCSVMKAVLLNCPNALKNESPISARIWHVCLATARAKKLRQKVL